MEGIGSRVTFIGGLGCEMSHDREAVQRGGEYFYRFLFQRVFLIGTFSLYLQLIPYFRKLRELRKSKIT